MPERDFERSITKILNGILERLRAVERVAAPAIEEITVGKQTARADVYTWQSARTLTTSTGIRFYVERDGVIEWCRADRSSGDGVSTATLDVLKNGTSIYTESAKPTVEAGEFLGDETIPDDPAFEKGDYFQIEIEATGGGTGPLRLTFSVTG